MLNHYVALASRSRSSSQDSKTTTGTRYVTTRKLLSGKTKLLSQVLRMSKENRELAKQLKELNRNIEMLIKATAINIGKEDIFKGKNSKEEKIVVLDKMGIPNEIIALIIGSTSHSVSQFKSAKKPKLSKQEPQTQTSKTSNEVIKHDEQKPV
jgi:hypothetical protein